ncbi:peptidoglycan-binding protein LysM [Tenacibaculum holothuriorum]|uniref:Peptidoglycan-binding protein LysM n=1 Tax=Tenacibaculum holothuriorum TaxID=1635173 RepID=A0A1Y2PBD1_9FLAO|nr:peptidoglycan-binding protein LysM [Tenacibaculum holothuriorum]
MLNRKIIVIRNLIFVIVCFITLTSFTTTPSEENKKAKPITVLNNTKLNFPYLQNDFVGFKEALAFKESQGRYSIVNKLGYLGKYQFGKSTLKRFRIYNTQNFLKDPELQEKAFIALCKVNKWILRKDIRRSVGKTINGVKITESGILAAAHLSGAGNVKKYLRSNGSFKFKDAFGTSIESYMKKFAGYDVANIKANKKPVV